MMFGPFPDLVRGCSLMAALDACAQGCLVIVSLPSDGYLKGARDLQD